MPIQNSKLFGEDTPEAVNFTCKKSLVPNFFFVLYLSGRRKSLNESLLASFYGFFISRFFFLPLFHRISNNAPTFAPQLQLRVWGVRSRNPLTPQYVLSEPVVRMIDLVARLLNGFLFIESPPASSPRTSHILKAWIGKPPGPIRFLPQPSRLALESRSKGIHGCKRANSGLFRSSRHSMGN